MLLLSSLPLCHRSCLPKALLLLGLAALLAEPFAAALPALILARFPATYRRIRVASVVKHLDISLVDSLIEGFQGRKTGIMEASEAT